MKSHSEYTLLLKSMRALNGLTQKQLAAKAGVSSQSISNIESLRHLPSDKHLVGILSALNAAKDVSLEIRNAFKNFRKKK